MKPIKKFSSIKSEEQQILESIKTNYGKVATEIAKNLGYDTLEEIAKEKKILTKLESLLKNLPKSSNVSEDETEEIEDKVVKKGEPKSLEDKTGEKENDNSKYESDGIVEEDDDAEEIEDEVVKRGEPKSLEDNDEEPKGYVRKIKTFEEFLSESDKTVNKNVSYRNDDKEEDYAEPIAASKDYDKEKEDEIEHDKDAAKDDYEHIADLKKDAADDKKAEDEIEESVVTEANVSGAYNDLENLLGTDMETMNDFQRIEDEGTWKEMSDFIEMVGDDEVLRRYKIKSRKDIDKLAKYIMGESVVTEAEIKSDDEFKEYAFTVLQKAFGDDFDEPKAQEVVDGLISKYNGDYGAMVGALQSSLG